MDLVGGDDLLDIGALFAQSPLLEFDDQPRSQPWINPGFSQTQLHPPSVAVGEGEPGAFTATDTEEEIAQSGSALLGLGFNAALLPPAAAAATVQRILPVVEGAGGARREPNRLLVNASFTQPDRYSYSAGGDSTGGPSTTTTTTTTAEMMGISGGGAFTEASAERGSSSKRKRYNWSSTREADDLIARADPSSSGSADINFPTGSTDAELPTMSMRGSTDDIKPPEDSTPTEIIQFLNRETPKLCCMEDFVNLNHSFAKQDQMAPVTQRRYVTTRCLMSERRTEHGYWKEKHFEVLKRREGSCEEEQITTRHMLDDDIGVKRTFRFHTINDEETNWCMHEYIPLGRWGIDLFLQDFYFRDVKFEEAGKQRVNTSNRTAAAKHRMRGPDDPIMVVKGESPAWHNFIKIYDRHPELAGSKVVYAVCCHCEGVLKAGTENGTKSLLTHCNRTCSKKNKN